MQLTALAASSWLAQFLFGIFRSLRFLLKKRALQNMLMFDSVGANGSPQVFWTFYFRSCLLGSKLFAFGCLNNGNAVISRLVAASPSAGRGALVGQARFAGTPVNSRNLHADCDFLSLLLPITRLDRH
jgi:hypothetical protein